MLRWGRPKAAEGGGSGARSAGKAREHGEVKGATGLVGGGRSPCYFIDIKIFENICDMMIISQIGIFWKIIKFIILSQKQ